MSETRVRASIEAYIAAWNEHDAAARARLLEQACGDHFVMRTSGQRIDGRARLDAMIADFQKRCPGQRAVLGTAIDVQGHIFRFAGRVEGPASSGAENFDAGECDDDGRIRLLLTFAGAGLASLPG